MWVISKNISIVISNADHTLIWLAIGWQTPVLGSDWSIMSPLSPVCSTPCLQGSDEAIDSLQITPDNIVCSVLPHICNIILAYCLAVMVRKLYKI